MEKKVFISKGEAIDVMQCCEESSSALAPNICCVKVVYSDMKQLNSEVAPI